jgi:hypothetical protein
MKNVYSWYVAVEGSQMALVLGCSGSEGLAGPGNTAWSYYPKKGPTPQQNSVLCYTRLVLCPHICQNRIV